MPIDSLNLFEMESLEKMPITENWIEFAAGAIALFALYVAFLSYKVAKKSLRISQMQYNDKQPSFSLRFEQATRRILTDYSNRKILLFYCTISNRSENKNTFKAFLEIHYRLENNNESKLILEHDPGLIELFSNNHLVVFPLNISLEGKEEKTAWFLYEQPGEAYQRIPIVQYKMYVTDINSKKESIQTSILNEIKL